MATRYYWRKDEVPDISPGFHADWDHTASAIRRVMAPTKLAGDTTTSASHTGSAPGELALAIQLIGPELAAGQELAGSGVNVEFVTYCLESSGNDDSGLAGCIRVVAFDGTIQREPAGGVSSGLGGGEFPFSGFPAESEFDLVGLGTTSYVTQARDRLVLEVGSSSLVSAVDPITCSFRIGSDDAQADAPAASGNTSTTNLPWAEHEFTLAGFTGPIHDSGLGLPQTVELQGLVLPVRMQDGSRYREYGILKPYRSRHRPHVIGRKRVPDE